MLCISVLFRFSSQKVFIISTLSGFVIYQFRVIPTVLALIYRNCPLNFKLTSDFKLFCKKGCSWRFHKFCRRVPVLQSLLNKSMGLRACGFIEGRLQHGCFCCVICKIFESTYFDEHLPTTASDSLNFDILLG